MKYRISAALVALGLFVSVNIGLAGITGPLGNQLKGSKAQGILFQACNSAIAEYNAPPPPNVVLAGSSLLVAPVWSVDARHFPQTKDLYHHHRCLMLEKDLKGKENYPIKVVCMALPGAMVSDQFLLVDKLLRTQRHPETLIITLSPRDLMDDLLSGETKTAVFETLMTPEDLPKLGDLYFPSYGEKLDFVLNSGIFLYGKRWRYQQKFLSSASSYLNRIAPSNWCNKTAATAPNVQGRIDNFLAQTNRAQVWERSIAEYRVRYKHFNYEQFEKQSKFLDYLLHVAGQRKINVILVNMPLTQGNLALMPTGLYSAYLKNIRSEAYRHRVTFVDCQSDPYYSAPKFYDTVHLNEAGGEHFIQMLARMLQPEPPKKGLAMLEQRSL